MMILHEFDYFTPEAVEEALALLSSYENPAILAGGTDLVVNLKEEIEVPEVVIDIKRLKELGRIEFKNNNLFIGALVTFSELIEAEHVNEKFPLIMETSKTVGSVGIRNRATLVGNICSAVPSMDGGPLLSVYEAEVVVRSLKGERKIPISNWFHAPRETAINKGEFVTHVSIPFPGKNYSGCFVKLGRYSGEDLAQASVAVVAFFDNTYRVAFGAVAPIPVRARRIEDLLNGKVLNDSLIEKAMNIIPEEISPITDIRASREYRMHMCKVMFERGIRAAVNRLKGEGPQYGTSVI
ncbi:MAG: xanthine dehydrogenase family protein subunit M [Candidatus Marinimicrobia bacterium]|nr:xanthine dehydrogenase family protein subunit M [Candidatus Neomarinimicrobiota bacterium]